MASPSPEKTRALRPPEVQERGAPPQREGFLLQGPRLYHMRPRGGAATEGAPAVRPAWGGGRCSACPLMSTSN
eukprot:1742456-Pyramimonas_sp.AAC.1